MSSEENDESGTSFELIDLSSGDDLPAKSKLKYEQSYMVFNKWRESKQITSLTEEVFLDYFKELTQTKKPSTLWTTYSMLKGTLNAKENINVGKYSKVTAYLKKVSNGYKNSIKVTKVLTSEQVAKFLNEAPADFYLVTKVVLIFAVSGTCRPNDLVNITCKDVQKHGNIYLVTIPNTEKSTARSFTIEGDFYRIVEKYISLRPPTITNNRFFLKFQNGKYTSQAIGKNKFATMPRQIAEYLKLPDAESYTGRTFRHTSTKLLSALETNAGTKNKLMSMMVTPVAPVVRCLPGYTFSHTSTALSTDSETDAGTNEQHFSILSLPVAKCYVSSLQLEVPQLFTNENGTTNNVFLSQIHQLQSAPNEEEEILNIEPEMVQIKEEILDQPELAVESEISFFPHLKSEEDEDLEKKDLENKDLEYEENKEIKENEDNEENHEVFIKEEINDLENNRFKGFADCEYSRENNYIYRLLMSDPDGEFQLAAYDFETDPTNYHHLLDFEKTTYFDKNKVAEKIIFYEFKRTNSYHILPERLAELAKEAVACFPRLEESCFYTSTTQNQDSLGALNIFYATQHKKEIVIGRYRSSFSKRKINEVSESETRDTKECKRKVLKVADGGNKLDWRTTSFKERHEFYKNSSLNSVLETFPNLKSTSGPIFIEADYCLLKDSPDNFCQNWSEIASKIIALAKRKVKNKDETRIHALLEENGLGENIENLSVFREERVTSALLLLPHLFPQTTKRINKSGFEKLWEPTHEDVLKGFIYHTKETKDLDAELTRIRNELKSSYEPYGIELGPYVVISGPATNKITSAHVIVGDWSYSVSSTMKAVDLCFKCIKLFQKPFPVVCDHVWQFLEVAVYKMQRDTNSNVTLVIQSLDKV